MARSWAGKMKRILRSETDELASEFYFFFRRNQQKIWNVK